MEGFFQGLRGIFTSSSISDGQSPYSSSPSSTNRMDSERRRHAIAELPTARRAHQSAKETADERMKIWRDSGDEHSSPFGSSSSSSSSSYPADKDSSEMILTKKRDQASTASSSAPTITTEQDPPRLLVEFEVRQLDNDQPSYFVTPAKNERCFFLARQPKDGESTARLSSFDSIRALAESNLMMKLVHERQPLYRPVTQLTPAVASVLEFMLFRLETMGQLAYIILNSRVVSASLRQQSRFKEMLPAAPIEATKTFIAGSDTLKKRMLTSDDSITLGHATPNKEAGASENDSDHGSAKTSTAKRRAMHEKQARERQQNPPRSNNVSPYAQLPAAKKKKLIQYLTQRNGGRSLRKPLSVFADTTRGSRTDWQHDNGQNSLSDDDDDDDNNNNNNNNEFKSRSDASASSSSSSSSLSYDKETGVSKGAHRVRKADAGGPPTPQKLANLMLARWKIIFNLNDVDELRGWLHLQTDGWFEIDAASGGCFTRTDTFETAPTLSILYKNWHAQFTAKQRIVDPNEIVIDDYADDDTLTLLTVSEIF